MRGLGKKIYGTTPFYGHNHPVQYNAVFLLHDFSNDKRGLTGFEWSKNTLPRRLQDMDRNRFFYVEVGAHSIFYFRSETGFYYFKQRPNQIKMFWVNNPPENSKVIPNLE